jgi:hypothetical protein
VSEIIDESRGGCQCLFVNFYAFFRNTSGVLKVRVKKPASAVKSSNGEGSTVVICSTLGSSVAVVAQSLAVPAPFGLGRL